MGAKSRPVILSEQRSDESRDLQFVCAGSISIVCFFPLARHHLPNAKRQVLNAKCYFFTETLAIDFAPNSRLRLVPCVLLALFAIQSLWFIKTQSLTYDEPAHIIAGSEAWRMGRFERWNDHPPLGRLWLTLPIAATPLDYEIKFTDRDFLVTRLQPGPEWLAWRTRPMNTLLGIALGVALWFATRRTFSEGAANVALALFAFTPSLIAHFSVATTDGIGALFIFLVAVQLVRWRHRRTAAQAALMGLLLGGLLLSKFYAPPLVLMALLLMLFISRDENRLLAGSTGSQRWALWPSRCSFWAATSFMSHIWRPAMARFAPAFPTVMCANGRRRPTFT